MWIGIAAYIYHSSHICDEQCDNMIGIVGGIICFIQLIPFCASIILTEAALNRMFDQNGIRR